jgi:Family of unknown function (DUF6527)
MSQDIILKHEFVEFIPDEMEQGTIYISIRFATASHPCLCGCGNKVVTPIRPTDWTLIFNGKTISLNPSIGNWSFPCQSHYWIRNNRVKWAPKWTREQIERGRLRDGYAKQSYFDAAEHPAEDSAERPEISTPKRSWWQAIKRWWS